MKNEFIPARMSEAEAQAEAFKAAAWYMKQKGLTMLPMKEQQDAMQHLSAGFYMGLRHTEKMYACASGETVTINPVINIHTEGETK